jgi:hypothetical protein
MSNFVKKGQVGAASETLTQLLFDPSERHATEQQFSRNCLGTRYSASGPAMHMGEVSERQVSDVHGEHLNGDNGVEGSLRFQIGRAFTRTAPLPGRRHLIP